MKDLLKSILLEVLSKLNINYEDDILVDKPNNNEDCDYYTNLALKLTKVLKDNPMNIANKIVENINNDNILKIEIKNPGFINFYVKNDYLFDNIQNVLNMKETYGSLNIGNHKKINIEFVSANPTGILHMGNARGGAYGDSLARIKKFAGFDVTTEYYVNDAGKQITNLALSIQARYFEICNKEFEMPENGYYGPEIKIMAQKLYDENKDNLLDKDLDFYKNIGIEELLGKIKDVLKEYRIEQDIFTSEKSIYATGSVENTIKELHDKGYTYELEDATWFKSSELGDSKDHVLITKDKQYTYLVPDIAYHIDKIKRGYDHLIDVLGTDHHGYVPRLKASLKAMGYDNDILDVKLLQLVRLVKNGEEVKMSKRTGNTITLKDLIDEVGVNAARYYFAMRSLDTQMDFDLELAKKKSSDNPVYYVSYAYARICTILDSYKDNIEINNYDDINTPEAITLLENVYLFEEKVNDAAIKELPHIITNYVYDLANSFHAYYSKYRIISDDKQKTQENINLIKAVKITLENSLNLIGVIPPEKM